MCLLVGMIVGGVVVAAVFEIRIHKLQGLVNQMRQTAQWGVNEAQKVESEVIKGIGDRL